jgi:hypothetical protein
VHQVIVYLIDPASGGTFTYLNSTTGAHIAWDQLREKVVTMRALRGTRVVPVVRLTRRPMKTFVGMKQRPEFEIVGWRQLGGDGGIPVTGPQMPQLTDATAASKPEPKSEPKPEPTAADATLAALEEVSEPSLSEAMADSIPW